MLSVWLFLWSKYVRILDCWPKSNVAFHSEIKGFVRFGWVLAHRHLLSFHIGQVGWRLRWYPLSSPSLHQFSYCRPQTLGGTVSNGLEYLRTPQNTSEYLRIPSFCPFHIFLIIHPVVAAPTKSLLRLCKNHLILGRSSISFWSYRHLFSSKKWTSWAVLVAFLYFR